MRIGNLNLNSRVAPKPQTCQNVSTPRQVVPLEGNKIMKKGNVRWFKLLIIAGVLALANRSHAYFTTYLDPVSNALTFAYVTLTNNPEPSLAERQQIVLIGRALRTLSLPSTNVSGDYKLFVKAATQLGPIGQSPAFLELGTNVFDAFTNDAQAQIIATANRIAALNDFVGQKRAASNQIRQAQATLDKIPTLTDIRLALVVGRQVFNKINVANRLAAIAEAKPGFAPDAVIGKTLTHNESGRSGTVHFDDASNATQTESGGVPRASAYSWTRTGLNTATLVLTEEEESGTSTTTVKIKFTSGSGGTFSFKNVTGDSAETGYGTFTLE